MTLRSRSKKRQRLDVERRVFVWKILRERPWCQAVLPDCTGRSTEVHEIKTRARGGSTLDPDNVLALCHRCHRWITEHPLEAHQHGWMAHAWERS